MPIKACTRCGLKVLVDAATAASDSYLCPRCAPDAKPASSSPSRPATSPGKRASIKVTCPYCGASFSGSKPSRPAKGGCPVCQKELILLPDGTIQAAATFNLAAWQKEKKTASNPPSPAPAPAAPAPDATIEMPAASDPLGGATILDMGGPSAPPPISPPPSIDEQTMSMPGGLGGETMLGMGGDLPSAPSPAPTIDEPPPPMDEPPREDDTTAPPDLGGATILDMGPRAVEPPPPEIEEPAPEPDLLSETMPGMDRPPAEESPVEPPIPPPIPEPPTVEDVETPVDVSEGPTVRETESPAPEEPAPTPEPEPDPASIESAPEIPVDMGGQTILGLGGDLEPPKMPPAPSIEEPEAVPILAKDVPALEPPAPEPPKEDSEAAAAPAAEKPYVYQPIPRKPRAAPAPAPPPPAPPTERAPAPQLQSPSQAPVLGSDFRMQAVQPPPKPPEREREERRPAGPKTTAAILPRAHHSLKKLVLAWALMGLPVAAAFVLNSMQKNPSVEKVIHRFSQETSPGLRKMDEGIRKAVTKTEKQP